MHPVTTWEPDPRLSLGRVMKADGAVGEVVGPIRPLIRLGAVNVPGGAALPQPCPTPAAARSRSNLLVLSSPGTPSGPARSPLWEDPQYSRSIRCVASTTS